MRNFSKLIQLFYIQPVFFWSSEIFSKNALSLKENLKFWNPPSNLLVGWQIESYIDFSWYHFPKIKILKQVYKKHCLGGSFLVWALLTVSIVLWMPLFLSILLYNYTLQWWLLGKFFCVRDAKSNFWSLQVILLVLTSQRNIPFMLGICWLCCALK